MDGKNDINVRIPRGSFIGYRDIPLDLETCTKEEARHHAIYRTLNFMTYNMVPELRSRLYEEAGYYLEKAEESAFSRIVFEKAADELIYARCTLEKPDFDKARDLYKKAGVPEKIIEDKMAFAAADAVPES